MKEVTIRNMLSHSPQFSNRIRVGSLIGLVILILGGIFLVLQRILTAKRTNNTIPTVAYCDLIGDPKRYDQATVRVSATHVVGFEWSYLMDNDCPEETWTILVSEDPTCSVDLPTPILPLDWRGGTRNVTVVGRFNGERGGYGHLGQYPYKFDVICIEEVGRFTPWDQP